MDKKLYQPLAIAVVVTAVIVGPLGYAVGAKGQTSKAGKGFNTAELNGGAMQRQGFQRGIGTGTGTAARRMMNGGMTVGEVLSVSEGGLTVKLADGGSRNILLPATIAVSESKEIDRSEIVAGKFVMISGETNSDSSVTARNIQLMDKMPTVMPFRAGVGTGAGSGATPPPGM